MGNFYLALSASLGALLIGALALAFYFYKQAQQAQQAQRSQQVPQEAGTGFVVHQTTITPHEANAQAEHVAPEMGEPVQVSTPVSHIEGHVQQAFSQFQQMQARARVRSRRTTAVWESSTLEPLGNEPTPPDASVTGVLPEPDGTKPSTQGPTLTIWDIFENED